MKEGKLKVYKTIQNMFVIGEYKEKVCRREAV